jgi:3-deoxy-D-manno-octulosonic-acid transferase
MHLLYSILLLLAAVVTGPYWLVKSLRKKKYLAAVPERLGLRLPALAPSVGPIWIHAVSVGEVLAAKPLVTALVAAKPLLPIVISTVTTTGRELAQKEFPFAAAIVYFPFDWGLCIKRFLRRLQPRLIVIMETELWPNFMRHCSRASIPLLLANGRISDRSFRRYLRFRFFAKSMLVQLSAILAQTSEDRDRFVQLGAPSARVFMAGNLKFDFPPPSMAADGEWLQTLRFCMGLNPDTPVVVIGSTMRGEEPLFLEAFGQVLRNRPDARLIIAPRHPERFNEVADCIQKTGMTFLRRSMLPDQSHPEVQVLLLDTIGELRKVYSLASVAIIGGSFLPFGGHNILEPAALGKAILFGPHMTNFKEIADLFKKSEAARQTSLAALPGDLDELLQDSRLRDRLGERASFTYSQNQGATQATLQHLARYLE